MNKKLDTILFDLDNTLVYTDFEYICTVLEGTFKGLGKKFDYALAEKFWFSSGRSYFASENLDADDEQFWKLYRARNKPKNNCAHTYLFNDINFLDLLKSKGCKTGIVTSNPEYMGKPVVKKIGEDLFDVVVYQNALHGYKHKPDPQGINKALEKLDSKPENSAYVGDTEGDMEAAKKAGVLPIFIDRETHALKHEIDTPIQITSLYEIEDFVSLA